MSFVKIWSQFYSHYRGEGQKEHLHSLKGIFDDFSLEKKIFL